MTLLSLTTKRDNARKALASASSKDRAKATAELEKAITALATFNARTASKSKARSISAADDAEEDEDEDEDEEEDEDEDEDEDEESKSKSAKSKDKGPKKPMEDSDDDDDSGDDDDDSDDEDDDEDEDAEEEEDEDEDEDEEEDEDEDEEARAKAIASARQVLRTARKGGSKAALTSARAHFGAVKRAVRPKALARFKSLKSVCQRITGKKSLPAILGALESQAVTAKGTEKLSAKVARMQSEQRRTKVSSMLSAARRDGKITKDEQKTLAADGMKQGTKWLRAHLDVRPKLVRSMESGALVGRTPEGGKDGDQRRAEALDVQSLSGEQRKAIETMAAGSGKSFDDFLADMNKTRAKAAGKNPR